MTPASSERTLSLVLPAFNEESNLPILFEKALQILPKYFSKFEIIVVDDGSTDKTSQVVEEWSKKNPAIKLVRHPANRGVGSALRDAFQVAQYDWLFQSPSDNQFDISEIEKFLPEMEKADLIQGGRVNLQYTFFRKIVTWVYRTLLKLLFDIRFMDPTWVKMIRRDAAKSLVITTDGFFGELEVVIRAKRKGYRFSEVGVHTQKRLYGKSTASSLGRIVKTFFELVRFKLFVRD